MVCKECNEIKTRNKTLPKMGSSILMRVIRLLTSGQRQMESCVEYMLGVFVFENVRTLEHVTTKRVKELLLQKKLQAQVTAVSDFLKLGYRYLLDTNDDVALNSRRALVRSNGAPQNDNITLHETKNDHCLKTVQVLKTFFQM